MNPDTLNELINGAVTLFEQPIGPLKIRGPGLYTKLSNRMREICDPIFQENNQLIWRIELFKSTKPTGLHTDVNYDADIGGTCTTVTMIPLIWEETTEPTTVLFNERYPKKVFEGYDPNTFTDAVTKESIPSNLPAEFLLTEDLYKEKLLHCKKGSLNGLTLKSVEVWRSGIPISFDSNLLHAAGYFNPNKGQWKMCVLGLGFQKNTSFSD